MDGKWMGWGANGTNNWMNQLPFCVNHKKSYSTKVACSKCPKNCKCDDSNRAPEKMLDVVLNPDRGEGEDPVVGQFTRQGGVG